MADCLTIMKGDPYAIKTFHPHHVRDSARLRAGYEAYKKKKTKQT